MKSNAHIIEYFVPQLVIEKSITKFSKKREEWECLILLKFSMEMDDLKEGGSIQWLVKIKGVGV